MLRKRMKYPGSVLVLVALLAIVGLVAVGPLAAGATTASANLNLAAGGSVIDSVVDANADGIPANLILVETKGTFGQSSLRGLVDFAPKGALENCPAGTAAEFDVAAYSAVHRLSSGDLIFAEVVSGYACTIPNPQFVIHAKITGGTGRFAGASGNYTYSSGVTALLLEADAVPPNIVHAAVHGTISGTVNAGGN